MNFMRNESARKLRGGYYTPPDLAAYLARWVAQGGASRILEPSCGDGVFFDALASVNMRNDPSVLGFELDAEEAGKARSKCSSMAAEIRAEDFLAWAIGEMRAGRAEFDAALGNPPFVRYQYLPEAFQFRAETVFDLLGLKFTKHTNAWVSFVLASMAVLSPGGRLAMVVPSEIVHVTHAQSLRTYLGRVCSRLLVVDPEEIWFDGTQQGAVMLLAEKKRHPDQRIEGLGILPVRGRAFLSNDPESVFTGVVRTNGPSVEGKWTRALLTSHERALLDRAATRPQVHGFKTIAKVDVGIVTGANGFFLVPDETVRRYDLAKWAHPMFGRSGHCPGIIYDDRQHRANSEKGNPTNFLRLTGELTRKARDYIRLGESQGLDTRYKCRIRTPWYTVPSVYATDIGMLKRSHDTPRLIRNEIGAYTTDTAYRITTKTGAADRLVYSFLNGLTALCAELEGRCYGGGVLELVPSEIERLLVPVPERMTVDLEALDHAVRSMPMDVVLERQTARVLGAIGFSPTDQADLLAAWSRLRNRRQRNSGDALPDEA